MRHRIALLLSALTLLLTGSSCIENDIPYPLVECRIESIAAEGTGTPVIDFANRRVTLPLPETTDIQNVRITDVRLTEGAVSSQPIAGIHDLRTPLRVTLSLYQDYPWEIAAEQTIERSFTVEGQMGATEWNLLDRSARVSVPFEDLTDIRITSLKLGPAGITRMSCAETNDRKEDLTDANLYLLKDFTTKRQVYVTCYGRTEQWFLEVVYTAEKVSLRQADGWVRTAWLYGEGISGTELGFRYRKAGTEEWKAVDPAAIETDGGSFRTRLRGLEPETSYEAVACSGDEVSAVKLFTTQAELPLPNGDFEAWSQPGKIVYPYLSEATAFWDTGNKGSATVSATITESSSDVRPGSPGRSSAMLTSKFASLAGIGKFAAGNIFVGTYAETVGTNGKVHFGRPFTSRPVALRGWVKYEMGVVDRIFNIPPEGLALGTWDPARYGGTAESPVEVYSKDESTFFDKNSEAVVGYGEWMLTESVGEWYQFTIPIDYRATDIVPTHLIIVCSASRWGDYFSGSTRSRMWLDDFELVWE